MQFCSEMLNKEYREGKNCYQQSRFYCLYSGSGLKQTKTPQGCSAYTVIWALLFIHYTAIRALFTTNPWGDAMARRGRGLRGGKWVVGVVSHKPRPSAAPAAVAGWTKWRRGGPSGSALKGAAAPGTRRCGRRLLAEGKEVVERCVENRCHPSGALRSPPCPPVPRRWDGVTMSTQVIKAEAWGRGGIALRPGPGRDGGPDPRSAPGGVAGKAQPGFRKQRWNHELRPLETPRCGFAVASFCLSCALQARCPDLVWIVFPSHG